MGVTHYLPQPALPQVPGRGGPGLACRRAKPTCCRCRYFHVVFTLPARDRPTSPGRTRRWSMICSSSAAAETMLTIAADPQHLGARIGLTAVLHTWGSAMTHHPHVHMIVPGGGIALDGSAGSRAGPASSCPCGCSRGCFDGCFWKARRAHAAGHLRFFGDSGWSGRPAAFAALLAAPAPDELVRLLPSRPFAAPRLCWPTCRATRTASRSPTLG